MWPATFGLACCAIEMMSIVSSRYDIARFGMEKFSSSPRQADLMIVSGRVAHKMAAPLRQVYDQMLEPKWVIAMGACASSGGMFNNYTILQGVDKIVPVDIHVPGCPPRPEALMEGILRLHEKVHGRRAARVPDPRSGELVSYDGVPGLVETREALGRDDARRRPRAAGRGVHVPARRAGLQPAARHHRDRLPRLGRDAVAGYYGTAGRAQPQRAGGAGLRAHARAEADALHAQLPPAPRRRRLGAGARPGLARRRRDGRRPWSRSGRPPTGTSERPAT